MAWIGRLMCHIITWTGEKKQNCEVRMQIFLLPRHSMYVRWNVSIVKYGCIYIDLYYNPTLGLKYSPDSKWKITNLLSYSVASPQKYSPVWQYSQRFFVTLHRNTCTRKPDKVGSGASLSYWRVMRAGLLTYFNRASLCALFLTLRNFPQSQFQSKTKATKSLTDGNSPPCVILIHGITIYLYVGFCVARLDWIGTWKGRSEWDEQGKWIPRFCFYMSWHRN